MAEWPTLAELKAELGIAPADETPDAVLSSALAAAVETVLTDIGRDEASIERLGLEPYELVWDDLAVTEKLRAAALLMAVIIVKAPEAPFGIAAVFDAGAVQVARQHPTYTKLIKGSRVSFGVA